MNKKKSQMFFTQLIPEDLDLTMFLITNLTLVDYKTGWHKLWLAG